MKEQFIHVTEDGDKFYHKDREMKILHREDGPAIEYAEGTKEWWLNKQLHREDGPAVEYASGTKEWWVNGKLHRTDGPAAECSNGAKEWWLNGKELSEEDFNKRTKTMTKTQTEENKVEKEKIEMLIRRFEKEANLWKRIQPDNDPELSLRLNARSSTYQECADELKRLL